MLKARQIVAAQVAAGLLDAGNLPVDKANERIQELYAFLGDDVTVAIQAGVATVRAGATGELDRRGQRLFDKAIAKANRRSPTPSLPSFAANSLFTPIRW